MAGELASPTLLGGRRYVVVDRLEQCRAAEIEPLARALAALAPDTVVLLLARAPRVPQALERAVAEAGGEVRLYEAPKPWQLPAWLRSRAREFGLALAADAAEELVARCGPSRMRLERELEKLALAADDGRVDATLVRALAPDDSEESVWSLADAIALGRGERASYLAEDLLARGEDPARILPALARRARELLAVRRLLDRGRTDQEVARALAVSGWRAKRLLQAARRCKTEQLEHTLVRLHALELETRGGRPARAPDARGALVRAVHELTAAN